MNPATSNIELLNLHYKYIGQRLDTSPTPMESIRSQINAYYLAPAYPANARLPLWLSASPSSAERFMPHPNSTQNAHSF
jgi:hypothetical protein